MGLGGDKFKHLIAGFIIILVAVIWLQPKRALLVSIAIAAGKEAYDGPSSGNADVLDFFASLMGIALGIVVTIILQMIWSVITGRRENVRREGFGVKKH